MRILYAGPTVAEDVARLEPLRSAGHELKVVAPPALADDADLPSAEALLVLAPVTSAAIGRAERLRLVQVLGAGADFVDLEAARRAGVPVATTDGSNATSVAEHAMALTLALVRRLATTDRRIRQGEWPQFELYRGGVFELAGKTLGLVGFGHIGQKLARMARGFEMRALYYARHRLTPASEAERGAIYCELDRLLTEADVVSIQVPLTDATCGLIGWRELELMKRSALLINTSRGPVVDEAALVEALEAHRIAGAGLDVYAIEPLPPDHRLRQLDQVVLSPHAAGAAQESIQRTFDVALDNLARVSEARPVQHLIA